MKNIVCYFLKALVICQYGFLASVCIADNSNPKAVLDSPVSRAESPQQTNCQARLYRITGDYFECLLDVESAVAKRQDSIEMSRSADECHGTYKRRYNHARKLCDGLPQPGGSLFNAQHGTDRRDLKKLAKKTVGEVRGIISDTSPDPAPGQLILFNNCDSDLKIMSPTSSAINGTTLASKSSISYATGSDGSLGQNMPNTFMAAPISTDAQCKAAACQDWTDIQAAGQRMGYMWENNSPKGSDNLVYAAYCQPTNAAAKQCTSISSQTPTSPCCGSQMNFDKTFGTTFEITPNGGSGLNQDFVDLSTNYGSGPNSPPVLCGTPGANSNNCVSATANIFFNVPVIVEFFPKTNSCTFPQGGSAISCTEVSCPDAYQFPIDNKQVSCPSGATGYAVTFCPGSSQLPKLPSVTSTIRKITIQNNLEKNSPCVNGNTVSLFTSDGGQQVIRPGGQEVTIQGNYGAYPGLGVQINNWYWTSERLPVQAGNPQNPDNSGAQFILSSQCALSQAPPVYGKGIETYKIAAVTAHSSGAANECLVTIDEKQPYTDAVTPGCCAPPLPGMADVCAGPWGITNNQQPWPPE